MCLSPNPIQPRRQQRGSALVIAIFVIVVMLVLASALLRMGNNADEDVNLEVWSLRAFAAANSGADAALAPLFPVVGVNSRGCGVLRKIGTPKEDTETHIEVIWTRPDVTGFHGCTVGLSCTRQSADGVTQYVVRSTAVCETGNCDAGVNDKDTDNKRQCLRVSRSVEVEARE